MPDFQFWVWKSLFWTQWNGKTLSSSAGSTNISILVVEVGRLMFIPSVETDSVSKYWWHRTLIRDDSVDGSMRCSGLFILLLTGQGQTGGFLNNLLLMTSVIIVLRGLCLIKMNRRVNAAHRGWITWYKATSLEFRVTIINVSPPVGVQVDFTDSKTAPAFVRLTLRGSVTFVI